jgi:hypothetical protein
MPKEQGCLQVPSCRRAWPRFGGATGRPPHPPTRHRLCPGIMVVPWAPWASGWAAVARQPAVRPGGLWDAWLPRPVHWGAQVAPDSHGVRPTDSPDRLIVWGLGCGWEPTLCGGQGVPLMHWGIAYGRWTDLP